MSIIKPKLTLRVLYFIVFSLFCAGKSSPFTYASEPKTLFTWDFETQAEADAWQSNCLSPLNAQNGSLTAKYTNWDPFIVSPQFNLTPHPGQYVEIRMKSTGYSVGEIFFASSNEGKYNGFSQDKTVQWTIIHDGQWHTYQILPAWLSEPQIIKIRVDLGRPTEEEIKDNAQVAIDYIRIFDIDVDHASASSKTRWEANDLMSLRKDSSIERNCWTSEIGVIDPQVVGSNLYLEFEKTSNVESPIPFPRANLRFLTSVGSGIVTLQIPLFNVTPQDPDGLKFAKNVDLSAYGEFGAQIFRWDLETPKEITVKRLAFTQSPIGAGIFESQDNGNQIELSRLSDGKGRAQYETLIRNGGGSSLKNFELTSSQTDSNKSTAQALSAIVTKTSVDPLLGFNPTGDRLASKGIGSKEDSERYEVAFDASGKARLEGAFLAPGEAYSVVVNYEVFQAGKTTATFKITAESQEEGQTRQASIEFTPTLEVLPELNLPKMKYVEVPKKLESDYEIGAFYFPGWSQRSGWDKIAESAPIRKPLLGYYDESNPEVVDWQIKWAAENGIQFFFVDWYWQHGAIYLDHWVKAFQRAKYRSNLKWAIMWANHTGYGTHTSEDWKQVTKFWLDNYFNTPEYYKIDGKPVVVMWDHTIVDHDMIEEAKKEGLDLKPGEGCKRAFKIVRDMCIEAGFPGVYFIAIKWPEHAVDPGTVQKYADAGFDATTIYHFMYPGKGVKDASLYSFDDVASAEKPHWDERNRTGILPSIPNISTGWDSRPWHGFRNTVVYGRSVESFRKILKDYKEYAKVTGNKRVVFAPVNEWGEGSYIEPNNEFGFGMYEAIREELCKEPEGGFPVNYAPYEVGLGPYDLPEKQ